MAVSVKSKIIQASSIAALVLGSLSISVPAQAAFPFSTSKKEVPSLAPMLEQVTPAVVNISVKGSKEVRGKIGRAHV